MVSPKTNKNSVEFVSSPNQKKTAEKLDDLVELLEQSLRFFKQDTEQAYKSLQNFKLFEKNIHRIKLAKNASKSRNILYLALSYWDLIILAILSIIFASYVAFFIASYYSKPNLDVSTQLHSEIRIVYKWLVAKWMQFNNFKDFSKEECALIMPDLLNSVLRPVDNCGMCHRLTEIKRVSNISKEEFLRNYAYTGVPVIITDAIKNWSALKVFNFQFLKDLYLNVKDKKLFDDNRGYGREDSSSRLSCQFFPYRTKFKSLVEVLEMNAAQIENTPWYVGWSNCNNKYVSKILRKHYKRPYFLPDESEMSRLDWIFMGTPGYGAEIHIDDVNNPSWQAQISGVKRWTFKPTAECLFRCPSVLYADVYPGDIIVFDSNRWFHSTFIVGNDLSLTIGSEYD